MLEDSKSHRDLPLQPKAIIGREQLLAAARQRLSRAAVRLLTLTGPPGVGKTRMAVELAANVRAEFNAGVKFVDLAAISDPHLVIVAVARRLDLGDVDRRVAVHVVEEFLSDKALLLLLDNFEQVLDAADLVAHLLATCPGLKVVATSRAPLHVAWEYELPVPSLELPDLHDRPGADAVAASPAGQLFIERAQAVDPDFVLGDADAAAVAEICAHLDGLPLAIELAAARIKLFPPRALLGRLIRTQQSAARHDSPLRLLADQARDLPPRQRTLLSAISWSYDLLNPREQAVFRRLSVFVGGCSVEAAEAVGAFGILDGLDVVGSLVDKSLVWREEQPDGEPRLRMLETIREYAREQLGASDEADAIPAWHAAYYLDLVERAALQLVGPHQQTWYAHFDRERDNLRAVERWATARGDADRIVRLWTALWPYWLARDDASESRERLEAFLPLVGRSVPAPALAGGLHGAGLMAEKLGDYTTCRVLLEQSLEVARQFDDRGTLAAVLDSLGRQTFIEGHYAESRALLEESQAILREADDSVGLARVLSHLGFLEYLEGRPRAARVIYQQGLALALAADDQHRVAEFMDNLGNASVVEGDLDDAARMFQEAIAIWRQLGQRPWLAMALNNLGRLLTRQGEVASARGHLLEALSLSHHMGNRRRLAYILSAVAALAAAEGETERAVSLDAIASAAVAEIGAAPSPYSEVLTGKLAQAASGTPVATMSAGRAVTLDQAVEESLSWLADPGRHTTANEQLLAVPSTVMPTVAASPPADGLTRREREVVALLALGVTNRQVADALVLTEGTVENYVQRILGKLGFNKRAQIAVWAVGHGLGPDRQPD